MKQTIYLDRGQEKAVEEEERNVFLRSLLLEMGIPIQDIWSDDDILLSVENKVKLREILEKYEIEIISEGRDYQVYFDGNLVGQWLKPIFKIKTDYGHYNPNKRVYSEMIIEFYSVFLEEDDNE